MELGEARGVGLFSAAIIGCQLLLAMRSVHGAIVGIWLEAMSVIRAIASSGARAHYSPKAPAGVIGRSPSLRRYVGAFGRRSVLGVAGRWEPGSRAQYGRCEIAVSNFARWLQHLVGLPGATYYI